MRMKELNARCTCALCPAYPEVIEALAELLRASDALCFASRQSKRKVAAYERAAKRVLRLILMREPTREELESLMG